MTTLLQIVQACENQLGWNPPYASDTAPRRTLAMEVHKLKAAMAKPEFSGVATNRNLALALEFSKRRHLPVRSPIALLYRITDALALAADAPTVTGIGAEVADAVRWEQERDDDQSLRWIHRLTRAAGCGQVDVLQEWKTAGRG